MEEPKILAALGSAIRLELVKRLSLAETIAGQSISELAEGTGLTRQAVTRHLEVLADAGLVKRLRPGRATYYELNTDPLGRAIAALTLIANQQKRTWQKLEVHKKTFVRLSTKAGFRRD